MWLISLPAAATLDLLLGDPQWLPHPIRWIGNLIMVLERWLYPAVRSRGIERMAGGALVAIVMMIVGGGTCAVLVIGKSIHPFLGIVVEVVVAFYCLSVRSLRDAALAVYRLLSARDLSGARREVAMIVGRDTGALTEQHVARATVETVAESIVDGVVSPLLYFAVGGPVAAILFKAVSTMDSMIGYNNERYRWFGTVAARLDDILNFTPARLTAFLIIPVASLLAGVHPLQSLKSVWCDRLKHPSPNSAHGEAAVAGALGVQLGGIAHYKGIPSEKPCLNSSGREVVPGDIQKAVAIATLAGVITLFLVVAVRLTVVWGMS